MPYKWKDAWEARHPTVARTAAAYMPAAYRVDEQRAVCHAANSRPRDVRRVVRFREVYRSDWPAVQKAQRSPVPQKPDTTLEDLHTIREYQAAEEEALSGRMCRDLAEYR